MINQKVVLVKSYFSKIKGGKGEALWTNNPYVEYSRCKIDSERLNNDLQKAIEQLNEEGYRIMQITPVVSGLYDFSNNTTSTGVFSNAISSDGGYGFGFSYTDSMIIVAELASSPCTV